MELNTLWIARDEDGSLFIYWEEPKLDKQEGEYGTFWDGREAMALDKRMYPEVTFENSPQRLISFQSIWCEPNRLGQCGINFEVVSQGVPKGCVPRVIHPHH